MSFLRSLLISGFVLALVSALNAQLGADVVINEILYHSPDDLDELEFVELTNNGDEPVDLGGWKLSSEVKFEFPPESTIRPDEYVVIAKNSEVLKEFYGVEATGEFSKSLSNSGGKLNLRNADGDVIDSVEYKDRAPWPLAADGYSASIERISVAGASDNVANWAPSKLSDNYDKTPSGTPGAKNSVAGDAVPISISSVTWNKKALSPNELLTVTVTAKAPDEIESAELHYGYVAPGKLGDEEVVELTRDGNVFSGNLSAGPELNRLLRFRVVAKSKSGATTVHPHPNEVRPAFTVYVNGDLNFATIPVAHLFFVDEKVSASAEEYRKTQEMPARRSGFRGFRGPPPDFDRGGRSPRDEFRRRPRGDNDEGDSGRDEDRPSREEMRERFRREFPGGFDRRFRGGPRGRFSGFPPTPLRPQGNAALIYTDPKTGASEVFDFINVVQRKSGWKARLHKDRHLLGMSTVNFLFESDQRTTVNESLSYTLYELAGNKSYQHGFMRVAINGKPAGYHVYFEQPNGNFFSRNDINNKGEFYKLIWTGSAEMSPRVPADQRDIRPDITGRYEKKSDRHKSHKNLVELIELFEQADSDDETWKLIEKHIEVDQVINYLAVNSLVSHWDGFFNNYFVYFDRKGTGKWSMYPWDQDSTWSQRGGSSEELYEMPLYFGAEGATPDGLVKVSKEERLANRNSGGFGRRGFGPPGFGRGRGGERGRGFGWWRQGGDFSRPLLANPTFYARFKQRLDELTKTVFTKKEFGPRIDALKSDLESEVRLRARMRNEDEGVAVEDLDNIMEALHEHLIRRHTFVRTELAKSGD